MTNMPKTLNLLLHTHVPAAKALEAPLGHFGDHVRYAEHHQQRKHLVDDLPHFVIDANTVLDVTSGWCAQTSAASSSCHYSKYTCSLLGGRVPFKKFDSTDDWNGEAVVAPPHEPRAQREVHKQREEVASQHHLPTKPLADFSRRSRPRARSISWTTPRRRCTRCRCTSSRSSLIRAVSRPASRRRCSASRIRASRCR